MNHKIARLTVLTCAWGLALAGLLLLPPLASQAQQPAYNLFHNAFYKNIGDRNSTLSLHNPTSTEANVVLNFFLEGAGGTATQALRTVPGGNTLVIQADDIAELSDGLYTMIASSDQPLQSVVNTHRVTDGALVVYRGVISGSGVVQYFGPIYKGGLTYSSLSVMNASSVPATIQVEFLSLGGSIIATTGASVAPGAQQIFPSTVVPGLPDSFVGWARVSSDEPVVGLLAQGGATGTHAPLEFDGPLSTSTPYVIPRAFKNVDEGGGPYTTRLIAGNLGTAVATVTLNYYAADGMLAHSATSVISASGALLVDLSAESNLPPTGTWAVSFVSNEPLAIGELTERDTTSGPGGDYEGETGTELHLPRLVRFEEAPGRYAWTVFSVQNVGTIPADVQISYFNTGGGTAVYTQTLTLPPAGWARYNQNQMPAGGVGSLPPAFIGYAVITANQPVMTWVDEYNVAPITSVYATSDSPTALGTSTHFWATPNGGSVIRYSWSFGGAGTGEQIASPSPVFTYSTPGFYQAVVSATNAAGRRTASTNVFVCDTQWTGINSNWFDGGNWTPPGVPGEGSSVLVAGGASYWPIITGTTQLRNLFIGAQAYVHVAEGVTLTVSDTLLVHGVLSRLNVAGNEQIVQAEINTPNVPVTITLATGSGLVAPTLVVTPDAPMGQVAVAIQFNTILATSTGLQDAIRRVYYITPTNQTTATVRFYFDAGELGDNIFDEIVIYHYSDLGSTWTAITPTARGGVSPALWMEGVLASYSPFTLASPANAPTSVALRSLTVQRGLPVALAALAVLGCTWASARLFYRRKRAC